MTNYTYEFDRWDATDAMSRTGDVARDSSRDPSNSGWSGSTVEKAKELVRYGWEAGVAIDGRDAAHRIDEVPAFEYSLAEEGAEADVGAFLEGEPACMGDMRRFPLPKPLVRIGVNLSTSCVISSEKMMRVGQSILACVERLRSAGYPTVVDCVFAVRAMGREDECFIRVRVQESDQPVAGAVLAFWVAHPSALRRVMFAMAETLPQEVRTKFGFHTGGGYGYPITRPDQLSQEYDEWAPSPNDSDEAIEQWAMGVIQRRTT